MIYKRIYLAGYAESENGLKRSKKNKYIANCMAYCLIIQQVKYTNKATKYKSDLGGKNFRTSIDQQRFDFENTQNCPADCAKKTIRRTKKPTD